MNRYILQDNIIHLFLFKSKNNNHNLQKACLLGHRHTVELMISKGANDWDCGFWGACLGGHRDLAEFMILKGVYDWELGLWGACEGGHRDLAEWLIDLGANPAQCYNIKHSHPL